MSRPSEVFPPLSPHPALRLTVHPTLPGVLSRGILRGCSMPTGSGPAAPPHRILLASTFPLPHHPTYPVSATQNFLPVLTLWNIPLGPRLRPRGRAFWPIAPPRLPEALEQKRWLLPLRVPQHFCHKQPEPRVALSETSVFVARL